MVPSWSEGTIFFPAQAITADARAGLLKEKGAKDSKKTGASL
jgi:hypothetical protein